MGICSIKKLPDRRSSPVTKHIYSGIINTKKGISKCQILTAENIDDVIERQDDEEEEEEDEYEDMIPSEIEAEVSEEDLILTEQMVVNFINYHENIAE